MSLVAACGRSSPRLRQPLFGRRPPRWLRLGRAGTPRSLAFTLSMSEAGSETMNPVVSTPPEPAWPTGGVRSGSPTPRNRSRGARLLLWLHLAACLVVWPAVYATVVIATFVGIVIAYNDHGGPLFWPLAWIASATAYGLVVGIPLAICADGGGTSG